MENWQTELLILLGNSCSSDGYISENVTNKHLGNGDCFQLLPLARCNICCCVFMSLFGNFSLSLGRRHQCFKARARAKMKMHVWGVCRSDMHGFAH